MPQNDVYESFDGTTPSRFGNMLKVGAALFAGAGVGYLSVSYANPHRTGEAQFTSLIGGPTSLRQRPMTMFGGNVASLPGPSPWKELAIATIEESNKCGRDMSLKANPRLNSMIANLDSKSKAELGRVSHIAQAKAAKFRDNAYDLAGVTPPLDGAGIWDPLGLSADTSEGKLYFYREAELKHGRVCMVGTLGFFVAEKFHPFQFTPNVDEPSLATVTDTSLTTFWVGIFIILGGIEVLSSSGRSDENKQLLPGNVPGDLQWDPFNFLPDTEEDLERMTNRELLHGRLAMISLFGQIAEELVTGEKLHGLDFITGSAKPWGLPGA